MDVKKRTSNFSAYEKQFICELAKDFPIVLNTSKDAKTKKLKDTAWNQLYEQFKSDQNVQIRTLDSIRVCYMNLVQRAKTDDASHKREVRQTGGGPAPPQVDATTSLIKETAPQLFESIRDIPDDDDETSDDNIAGEWLMYLPAHFKNYSWF